MLVLEDERTPDAVDRPFRTSRRRRVVGVDIWVETPAGAQAAVEAARQAAADTHLRLLTSLHLDDDVVRARFVGRDPEGHLGDSAIVELLVQLGERLRWFDVRKLEEFDGVPNYIPLPS